MNQFLVIILFLNTHVCVYIHTHTHMYMYASICTCMHAVTLEDSNTMNKELYQDLITNKLHKKIFNNALFPKSML